MAERQPVLFKPVDPDVAGKAGEVYIWVPPELDWRPYPVTREQAEECARAKERPLVAATPSQQEETP